MFLEDLKSEIVQTFVDQDFTVPCFIMKFLRLLFKMWSFMAHFYLKFDCILKFGSNNMHTKSLPNPLSHKEEICSSNLPVVTEICDSNKSRARHHPSLKLGSKLKYLNVGQLLLL